MFDRLLVLNFAVFQLFDHKLRGRDRWQIPPHGYQVFPRRALLDWFERIAEFGARPCLFGVREGRKFNEGTRGGTFDGDEDRRTVRDVAAPVSNVIWIAM